MFHLPILPCQWGVWECTKSQEGAQPGQLTKMEQGYIPYHMMSCSGTKAREKKLAVRWKRMGWNRQDMTNICSDGIYLPKKLLHLIGSAFLEVIEPLPASGKQWINSLFGSICRQHLLCLVNSLCLTFLPSSSIPLWGSELVDIWGSAPCWGYSTTYW